MQLEKYYELGVKRAFQDLVKTAGSEVDNELKGLHAGLGVASGTGVASLGAVAGGHALERKLTDAAERSRLVGALKKNMPLRKGVTIHTDAPSFLLSRFDPSEKRISVSSKPTPSVLAHEMGHASGKRMAGGNVLQMGSRITGKYGVPVSLIAQAFTDPDSTTTKALQYGPSIAMIPMLAEELRASTRAAIALKRLGGKGAMLRGLLSLVPAFGTYAATASSPLWGGKIVQHYANPHS